MLLLNETAINALLVKLCIPREKTQLLLPPCLTLCFDLRNISPRDPVVGVLLCLGLQRFPCLEAVIYVPKQAACGVLREGCSCLLGTDRGVGMLADGGGNAEGASRRELDGDLVVHENQVSATVIVIIPQSGDRTEPCSTVTTVVVRKREGIGWKVEGGGAPDRTWKVALEGWSVVAEEILHIVVVLLVDLGCIECKESWKD